MWGVPSIHKHFVQMHSRIPRKIVFIRQFFKATACGRFVLAVDQDLATGDQDRLFHWCERSLRFGIEPSDRFDAISHKLHSTGPIAVRGVEIKNRSSKRRMRPVPLPKFPDRIRPR